MWEEFGLLRTATSGRQKPFRPFTRELVAELGAEFGLPRFIRPFARLILNQAAADYKEELERSAHDRKSAHRELKSVHKRLASLQESVDALSDDAEYYLAKSRFSTASRNGRLSFLWPTRRLKKRQITSSLASMEATIEHTIGKVAVSGRPAEEQLAGAMIAAYLLWVTVARKEFSLDWTQQNDPVSDAAIWCTRVAKQIAPEVPPSKIRTAASKVQKRSIKSNNLINPFKYLMTYFKRSGLLK